MCADPPRVVTGIRAGKHQISYSGQTRPYTPRAGKRRGRFSPFDGETRGHRIRQLPATPRLRRKTCPRPNDNTDDGLGSGAGFMCADPPRAVTGIRAGKHQISYSGQTRPYTPRAVDRRGRFPRFDGESRAHAYVNCRRNPRYHAKPAPRPPRVDAMPGRGRVLCAPIHHAPSPEYVRATTRYRIPGKPAPTPHAPGIVGAGFHRLTAEPVPTTYVICRRDPVNHAKPAPPPPLRVQRKGPSTPPATRGGRHGQGCPQWW